MSDWRSSASAYRKSKVQRNVESLDAIFRAATTIEMLNFAPQGNTQLDPGTGLLVG
jgi:hypothetical protein